MMASIIIVGSVVLAAAYASIWWLRPSLRRQIEVPNQRFAAAARRYDSQCARALAEKSERRRNDD